MKIKFLFWGCLLLVGIGMPIHAENSMSLVILPLSGEEQIQTISQIGQMIFRHDSIFLYSKNGDLLEKSKVKDIQNIHYRLTDVVTRVETTKTSNSVRIFPNPTHNMIIVRAPSAKNAYIFDLNGTLLQKRALDNSEDNVIDVRQLPKGEYILLIDTTTFKFLKQ